MAGGRGRARSRSRIAGVVLATVFFGVVSVAATTARPARATRWDPRIAPIAREVERLRHLRFLHPIPARFLSDAAFRKVVAKEGRPKAKDKRRDRIDEAELRSL